MAIQFLRGTAEQRLASTQTLPKGQPFYETDTGKQYIGDGITPINELMGTEIGLPVESGDGESSVQVISENKLPDGTLLVNKTQGRRSFTIGQRNLNGGYQTCVSGEFNTIPIITEEDIKNFGAPDAPEGTYFTWACGDILATGNGVVASGSGSIVGGNKNYSGSSNSLIVGVGNQDWINDDEKEYYDEYVTWKTTGELSSDNFCIEDFLVESKLFRNTSTGNITGGENNEVRGIHTVTSGSNNFNNSNQSIVIGRNNNINSDNIYGDENTSCSAFIGSDISSTKGHHKILLGQGISSDSYSNIFGFGAGLTFSNDYQILLGRFIHADVNDVFNVGYNLTEGYDDKYAIKTDKNNNVYIQNKPVVNSEMPIRAKDIEDYINPVKFYNITIASETDWKKTSIPVKTSDLQNPTTSIQIGSVRIQNAPQYQDQPYRKGDIFYDVSGNSTNSRYQAVDAAFKSIWIKNSKGVGEATNIADIYLTQTDANDIYQTNANANDMWGNINGQLTDVREQITANADRITANADRIDALNFSNSGSTTQTITSISQTEGKISATYEDIAFPVTSVEGKDGDVILDKSNHYTEVQGQQTDPNNTFFTQRGAIFLYEDVDSRLGPVEGDVAAIKNNIDSLDRTLGQLSSDIGSGISSVASAFSFDSTTYTLTIDMDTLNALK